MTSNHCKTPVYLFLHHHHKHQLTTTVGVTKSIIQRQHNGWMEKKLVLEQARKRILAPSGTIHSNFCHAGSKTQKDCVDLFQKKKLVPFLLTHLPHKRRNRIFRELILDPGNSYFTFLKSIQGPEMIEQLLTYGTPVLWNYLTEFELSQIAYDDGRDQTKRFIRGCIEH
ncbi:hypothetical protein BDA99DRAFT_530962 [Phascolomyces articulosus]|uniref:Uncharacterized protein n=1 Tax=Phascolomyces articulosus TaxID=60185 RepID=A0AAD5PJI3_9FUNG|nr:hypothetical protein BDA99DRAFT_530962 [Phascolomyces articulosus]